jgi:hypothetical protein
MDIATVEVAEEVDMDNMAPLQKTTTLHEPVLNHAAIADLAAMEDSRLTTARTTVRM